MFIAIFFSLYLIPLSLQAEEFIDSDADGLSDHYEEAIYYTDPKMADTDGDGFNDGEEIAQGYSPLFGDKKKLSEVDSDKDYLNDKWEILLGTGLMNPDSDGDLYLDGTEVAAGFDPLNKEPVQREKLIKVSLADQTLEYSFGGIVLEKFPISSGLKWTPTPKGEFKVLTKRPVVWYVGTNYNYPNTKWNLHFATGKVGRYYIHGAYWHNKFGQPMSHGCVNVSYANMENLYWFAQLGTKIIIN